MSTDTESAIVGERAELLARVALTRRLNVDVHPFDEMHATGIDLVCTIRDETVNGFLPFGVLVWGTARPLTDGADVSAIARQKLKTQDRTFFLPVLILAFSMHNDAAFFAWLAEPDPKSGKLILANKPVFRPFTLKQLDGVIDAVVAWYRKVKPELVERASEIEE
jgi:hypothetical protein